MTRILAVFIVGTGLVSVSAQGVQPTDPGKVATGLHELFMHDVCDGIDLWITNNQSPALLEHLGRRSASESEASLMRQWDGVFSNVR